MPRGGWRPGGGRPTKEAQAAKAKALLEAAAKGPKISPRAYLQAMLDSSGSSKSERMRAAELLLKLSPEPPPSSADSPPIVINVWGLPRGCQIGDDGQSVIWPDGRVTDPEPLEMFEPTATVPSTPRRRESLSRCLRTSRWRPSLSLRPSQRCRLTSRRCGVLIVVFPLALSTILRGRVRDGSVPVQTARLTHPSFLDRHPLLCSKHVNVG